MASDKISFYTKTIMTKGTPHKLARDSLVDYTPVCFAIRFCDKTLNKHACNKPEKSMLGKANYAAITRPRS